MNKFISVLKAAVGKTVLWRGLAAVFGLLLAVFIVLTNLGYRYEGFVNDRLGITPPSTNMGGEIVYESKFGELNAENNFLWPEAVEITKTHQAHLMVAVLGQEEDLLERGKLYVKLLAACCRQKNALGVYTSGVVFEPRFYEGFADMMQEGELPIFNWIWFGLYRSEKGICGYTYGMDVFGFDEMEVLDADADPSEVRDFLASMVEYVLSGGVTLHDGETIGFSAEDKHTITRSPGVALPVMTLKISYSAL